MHWTSGLVWKRCSEGQSWDAGTQTCVGTPETRRWNELMDEFMPRSFEGQDPWWGTVDGYTPDDAYTPDPATGPIGVDRLRDGQWRIPYRLELVGLTTGCENHPKINREVFPATPSSGVWSGSPYAGYSYGAWVVNFDGGHAYLSYRSNRHPVRLVRGGQFFAALPSLLERSGVPASTVTFDPITVSSEGGSTAWGGVRIGHQGSPQFQVNGGSWVTEAVVASGDEITVRMIAGAAGSAREAVLILRSGETTPTAANATNGGDEATVMSETSATFRVNVASAQPGLCGSAHGAASWTEPDSGLCASGSATAVTPDLATFTWSCNGVNGGQDMYCSAPRQHEVSTVLGGSGGSVSPTSRVVLFGREARFEVSAEPGQALETIEGCGGTLIGDEFVIERVIEACTVTASFVPVAAGACGPAAGQPSLMVPTSGLCTVGMASAVTSTNGGHVWQCAGSGGATGAYCSAPGLNTVLSGGGNGGSGEANIALTLDDETTCTLREAAVIEPPEGGPDGVEMSYGALAFTLENCGVGGSATVTVSYSGDENGVAYWKYVNDQWVTIAAALSSTFTLTDGGPFDADGETNGVIVDPGGPGVRRRASSAPVEHVIDAQAQPAEGGSVECVPNPVPDGGDASCTAISQAGYTFSHWSGDCEGMGGCDLASVGGALSVTAHFSVEDGEAGGPYAVMTTAAPVDGGHVLCTPNPVPHGGSATCTATPAAGFNFASWGGACSGSGVCTLSNVTAAQSVSASFTAAPPPPPPPPPVITYTVTAASSPAAGGTTACTPSSVASGGTSTCTATANTGYRFTGWSGDCTGTETSCTLTDITADRSVTASFGLNLLLPEGPDSGDPLQLEVTGPGRWTVSQASTAPVGSLGVPLPPGVTLPHGVVSLTLEQGQVGSSASVVLTYPSALPAGTRYYKYGPTAANPVAHWYEYPHAVISGHTITLTLTDGGAGDSDLSENGVIVDPGGPAQVAGDVAPDVTPIPTLSQWATLLLAGLMGLLAFGRLRRLPHA